MESLEPRDRESRGSFFFMPHVPRGSPLRRYLGDDRDSAYVRFWITRNRELAIREQIKEQVILGILSEDLRAGEKLPSVRAVARRYHVHPNTVSSAYGELVRNKWLEGRRGGGLFVHDRLRTGSADERLDDLLTALLKQGESLGYDPGELLARFELLVRPARFDRIVIAEHDPAMFEILKAEIETRFDLPVERLGSDFSSALVVALKGRLERVRALLPRGVHCVPLRLRSIREAVRGEKNPDSGMTIALVSKSKEIREHADDVDLAGVAPGFAVRRGYAVCGMAGAGARELAGRL